MIPRTLWQRHLLLETLKLFFLFLGCFLALYIAIDYSMQMQRFARSHELHILDIATYYGFQVIKRANLLIPLALLVATIRVLTSLNSRRELLAMQAGGLSLRKISGPFLLLGITATLFNLYSIEFLLPHATEYIDRFAHQHLKPLPSEKKQKRLRVVNLKDGSSLTFRKFDKQTATFYDLFWIRSSDDIWRIKSLTIDQSKENLPPLGLFVDHITRGTDGGLHKTNSYTSLRLAPLKAGAYLEKRTVVLPENRSLHSLVHSLKRESNPHSSVYNELLSHLTLKFTLPFLSPLVILAAFPPCTRFSRHTSYFQHFALGIFGFITFFVILHAASILGQNQVISPVRAILVPLGLAYGLSFWKFIKI